MSRFLPVAPALCHASSVASATARPIDLPAGFDLRSGTEVPYESAKVFFFPDRVEARFGVRLETGPQPYSTRAPLVLDRAYLVRDESGTEYRLYVRAQAKEQLYVEVENAHGATRLGARRTPEGGYRLEAYVIDDLEAATEFPAMVLAQDGTYRIGVATGRFVAEDGLLSLDGHYAQWGAGEISLDAKTLTFRFRRGGRQVELRFNYQPPRSDPGFIAAGR